MDKAFGLVDRKGICRTCFIRTAGAQIRQCYRPAIPQGDLKRLDPKSDRQEIVTFLVFLLVREPRLVSRARGGSQHQAPQYRPFGKRPILNHPRLPTASRTDEPIVISSDDDEQRPPWDVPPATSYPGGPSRGKVRNIVLSDDEDDS